MLFDLFQYGADDSVQSFTMKMQVYNVGDADTGHGDHKGDKLFANSFGGEDCAGDATIMIGDDDHVHVKERWGKTRAHAKK